MKRASQKASFRIIADIKKANNKIPTCYKNNARLWFGEILASKHASNFVEMLKGLQKSEHFEDAISGFSKKHQKEIHAEMTYTINMLENDDF